MSCVSTSSTRSSLQPGTSMYALFASPKSSGRSASVLGAISTVEASGHLLAFGCRRSRPVRASTGYSPADRLLAAGTGTRRTPVDVRTVGRNERVDVAARSVNGFPLRSIVVGAWDLERGAAPADQEARQIGVMLVQSGAALCLCAELEFAVWSATLGRVATGETVAVTGPLGHMTAGERLVCNGAFSQHPRYGWQLAVETFLGFCR